MRHYKTVTRVLWQENYKFLNLAISAPCLCVVLVPVPHSGLPASVPALSPLAVQCHKGGRGGYPSHGGSVPCWTTGAPWYARPQSVAHPACLSTCAIREALRPHLSSSCGQSTPFSWSPPSSFFPHINSPFSNLVNHTCISSNSLHWTQTGDAVTHCHSHMHFEPAFSTYYRTPTSFTESCFSLSAFQGCSIAVMLRPFQYCLSQFFLERFHLLHQCVCHQPIFTLVQQNGHYTSIQYWPRNPQMFPISPGGRTEPSITHSGTS